MRIRTVSKKGVQEVLTIVGPLQVFESNAGHGMSFFRDASGVDHYFNDSDGTYDGWGMGVADAPKLSLDDIKGDIDRMVEAREYVDPIIPDAS